MNETELSGLQDRCSKLSEEVTKNHSELIQKTAEQNGLILGLKDAVEDLRKRIAVLEYIHMTRSHDIDCPLHRSEASQHKTASETHGATGAPPL